jgi:hypothetical protein
VTEMRRVSEVDVNQDLDFTRREWIFERIGWATFALILLAGLLGLLGQGPLSQRQAGTPGSALWIEYQNPDRYQAPTELRLHVGPGASGQGELHILLAREYADRMDIQAITPEPDSVQVGPDWINYVFSVRKPGQPVEVVFDFEFAKFGPANGEVAIEQGEHISFRQFVFP